MPAARSSSRNVLVLSVAALPGSSDYPTRYLPTLWQLPVPGVCLRHLKSKWRTNIRAVSSGVMTSSSLFFFKLLGLINLPRGGCDSLWHSSHFFPLRNLFPFSSPRKENCCHPRQISSCHLLPLTGFACGVKVMKWLSAGAQGSTQVNSQFLYPGHIHPYPGFTIKNRVSNINLSSRRH